MAVKMVHVPLTVRHTEYQIMTNDTAAMRANVEALGKDQDRTADELNTLLGDGYTRIDSQVYSSGAGSFMLIVLHKPDPQPEKTPLSLMEQLENAAPGIAGHHLKLKRAGYMEVRVKDVESVSVELRGKVGITTTYLFGEGGMMTVTFSDGTRTAHIPAEHLEPVAQTEKPS